MSNEQSAAEVMRDNTIFELRAEIRHWRTVASVALAEVSRLSGEVADPATMTEHPVDLPHSIYLPKSIILDINDRLDDDEIGRHLLMASKAHDFVPVRVMYGSDYFGAESRHPCLVSPKAEATHLCPMTVDGKPTLAGVAAGPEMTPIFPERPVYAHALVALRMLRLREPEAYGKLLAIVQELSAERDKIVEREEEQDDPGKDGGK